MKHKKCESYSTNMADIRSQIVLQFITLQMNVLSLNSLTSLKVFINTGNILKFYSLA